MIDAIYNLAILYGTVGDRNAAISTLKLYLKYSPDDKYGGYRREVKSKFYKEAGLL